METILFYFLAQKANVKQSDLSSLEVHFRGAGSIEKMELSLMPLSFQSTFLTYLPFLNNLRKEIEFQWKKGIQFTFPGHELYPQQLLQLDDLPLFFSYLGHPIWLTQRGLSVVGSREPSMLSIQWLEKTLYDLFQKDQLFIVSGGARGVDQCAHKICLRYGVPTIVVLPSGIGKIYPTSLISLKESLLEQGGCFLSEYDWNQVMLKHHFIMRNRLIAGLSKATLILEARRKSGTMITAYKTMEMGKALFIVPSHPLDLNAKAGLDLICEGGTPVRDAEDLALYLRAEFNLPSNLL